MGRRPAFLLLSRRATHATPTGMGSKRCCRNDAVGKPFSYAELLARIRAVLRRADGRRDRGALRVGELAIDPLKRAVSLAGRPVELSAKEFSLLHALAGDPTRV